MSLINWVTDGEPLYSKLSASFPRVDGSVNDVTNRPLREVISNSGLSPDADFPAFAVLYTGSNSPEGVVTATIGKIYFDNVAGTLYVKATGSGNTGWTLIGGSGVITGPQLRAATPLIEIFDGVPGLNSGVLTRTHRYGTFLGTAVSILDTNTTGGGGVAAAAQILANGTLARRHTVVGNAAQSISGSCSVLYGLPVLQQLAAANIPAAGDRAYRTYTWEQTVIVDSQPASHSIEWGINNGATANSIETFTTQIGFKLIAKPSVNSGQFYLVGRLSSGGPLTTLASSLILPTTNPKRLKMVYTEGTTPTLDVYINSTLLFQVSGIANFPNLGPVASTSTQQFGLSEGAFVVAGAAGTSILDVRDGYYLVMEQ